MRNKEYHIGASLTIHFRTGATLQGKLEEFILCSDNKALIRLLDDPEMMQKYIDREFSVVNLQEVSFLNIMNVRVTFPENT